MPLHASRWSARAQKSLSLPLRVSALFPQFAVTLSSRLSFFFFFFFSSPSVSVLPLDRCVFRFFRTCRLPSSYRGERPPSSFLRSAHLVEEHRPNCISRCFKILSGNRAFRTALRTDRFCGSSRAQCPTYHNRDYKFD